ncbi:MAG: hypothetical protein NTV02_00080 [Candidatus Zambryskibacteria bacterium]|nr:hypothetical protein [Candidatus Zambryskibacteria bacterium]
MVRDIRSREFTKQKRKTLLVRLGVGLLLLLLLAGGVIWLSLLDRLQIKEIQIFGATVLPASSLEVEIQKELQGKYMWLFPKTNVFLYPQKKITQVVREKFPRTKTIETSVLNNKILKVVVTEREPFALWCNAVPTETEISQCYFLDEDGFVFDHAPQFSGNAYFKYYGLLPFEAPIGSYYLSSTTKFYELSDFVEDTKGMNITPLYINAKSQDNFELFVFGGGKIMFDTQADLMKVAERLSALLKTQNLVPRSGGELLVDYIDLRFGNKMFFKPKLP